MSSLAGHIRKNHLGWLGLLLLLGWIVCATVFAAERWLYVDSAYTLFRLLNLEPLVYDRFANLLQLWPAMLAARLGWPAAVVMHVANLTLPIFYLTAWAFFTTKQPQKSLIFPIMLWATGPQMFFLGYSEISMAALIFGILLLLPAQEGIRGIFRLSLWFLLLFLSHPAAPLLAVCVVLLFYLQYGRNQLKIMLPALAITLILQWLTAPATNPYDQHLLSQLSSASAWKNITDSYSLKYFTDSLLGWLWTAPVALFIGILAAPAGTSTARRLLIPGYALVCLLIIIVVYAGGDAPVMMEKYFYPWLLICLTPFFYADLSKRLTALLCIALAVSGWLYMQKALAQYTRRYAELQLTTQNFRKAKMPLLLIDYHPLKDIGSTWALPYESMCISALDHAQTVSIRQSETGKLQSDSAAAADSLFLGAPFMPPWPKRLLNPRYFRLQAGPYLIRKGAVKSE